jgi:endonuclease/exonuclease/phosphatase family metal-dependent hydrolase
MASYIKTVDPAFLGIQEGMQHQVEYLDQQLSDYTYIGVGRDDGKSKGEYCAIYYQTNKFNQLESGTFWLSETPDTISIGWDAALPRICTFGLFQDVSTKQRFWVFNTHFDHRGKLARDHSASLITEKIKSINSDKLPVVLMGDFNLTPSEEPIQTIKVYLDDARELSENAPTGPEGTSNDFKEETSDRRIDYIFTKGVIIQTCLHSEAKTKEGRYLSDHLPVIVRIKLQ